MASVSDLKRPAAESVAAAVMAPLKAWRLQQRVTIDPGTNGTRTMTVTDAAAAFSAFLGRPVPYQTWYSWERLPGDPAFKEPSPDYKRALFLFTGGEIRPDHAYPIEEWRAELAALQSAEGAGVG